MKQSPKIYKFRATKVENRGNGYFVNWFHAAEVSKQIKPGQFLMIEAGQYLKRPLSIYEVRNDEVGILYKVIGKGTKYLSELNTGDVLSVNAPLGNGFSYPDRKDKTVLIVAGGIGIAAFPYVARLANEQRYKVKTLYGARSNDDLVCLDELSKYGGLSTITDDGSSGKKGFVTELLQSELEENQDQEVLVCGPTPMLLNAIKVCNKFGLSAQISFEEHMACGYGICMSCVVQNKDGKYIRTCIEGPVIDSKNVLVN